MPFLDLSPFFLRSLGPRFLRFSRPRWRGEGAAFSGDRFWRRFSSSPSVAVGVALPSNWMMRISAVPFRRRSLLEPLLGERPEAQHRLLDGHLGGSPGEEVQEESGHLIVGQLGGDLGRHAHDQEAETVGGEPQGGVEGIEPVAARSTQISAPVADLPEAGAEESRLGRPLPEVASLLCALHLGSGVFMPPGEEVGQEEAAQREDEQPYRLLHGVEQHWRCLSFQSSEDLVDLLVGLRLDLGAGGRVLPPGILFVVAGELRFIYSLLPVRHSCPPHCLRSRRMYQRSDLFSCSKTISDTVFLALLLSDPPRDAASHPGDGCYDATT